MRGKRNKASDRIINKKHYRKINYFDVYTCNVL